MTKTLCVNCKKNRAKRVCPSGEGRMLCPQCCVTLRCEMCKGCRHYAASGSYAAGKKRETSFVALLDPTLDDECDEALALLESGKLGDAEKRMQDLLRRRPDYHMVQYGMGVCAVQREDYENAAKYFRRCIEIFPYLTEAHFNLGMVCLKLFDIAGMIASFREVVRIGGTPALVAEAKKRIDNFEKNVREHNGVSLDVFLKNMETFKQAMQKLEAHEFEGAVQSFEAVLADEPNHVQSWGNLGLAYAGMGKKAKAIECLDRALEIDPKYEVALVNRALVNRLAEGERIKGAIQSVDYMKEYRFKKKRSYIADAIGWMMHGK